jgi:hypothetical protein
MAKKAQYDGPYEQHSDNDDTISGLPLKSDGTLRESSNSTAQTGVSYSHEDAVESSARSGLQPKGKKPIVTTDSQLGGGRSILPELKGRNKL